VKSEFEDPKANKPRKKQRLEDLYKGEDHYLIFGDSERESNSD
jgi:hypothetical protein